MTNHNCTNPDALFCHHCDGEKERMMQTKIAELEREVDELSFTNADLQIEKSDLAIQNAELRELVKEASHMAVSIQWRERATRAVEGGE